MTWLEVLFCVLALPLLALGDWLLRAWIFDTMTRGRFRGQCLEPHGLWWRRPAAPAPRQEDR